MDYSITKDIINKSDFLSDTDAEYLNDNILSIQENWEKRQVFRTETEMRISVLNDIKFPTPAAKYWQCVREQAVFYENLVTLSFDYRRNKVEQRKLVKQIATESDPDEKELLQIDLEEKQFGQLNMEQVAKDRAREIRLWSRIMAESVQADPTFDITDPDIHQLVSYGLRFQQQMNNMGNASPSEMSNLVGQYDTTMKKLHDKGMLENTGGDKWKIRQNTRPVRAVK